MAKQTSTNLAAEEVEALAIGRKALPHAMRNLATLIHHSNPSQQRQAIELLLKHTMADRALQMQADGTIGPVDGKGGDLNITINKVDARLIEVMDALPPHLKAELGAVLGKIEAFASGEGLEIYEGEIIEGDLEMKTCECGCGEPVKPGNRFINRHHLRVHPNVKKQQQENLKYLKRGKTSPAEEAKAAGKLPESESDS